MTALEESGLIRDAISGNGDAFASLYRDNHTKIFLLLMGFTRNREDAEDLTADTFMQAFRKLHLFRGESRLGTWLHRIACNVFHMSKRRKPLPIVPIDNVEFSDNVGGGMPERASATLKLNVVFGQILQLPIRQRQVLILRAVYGFTCAETAKAMHTSSGCAKSQLNRARGKLRR